MQINTRTLTASETEIIDALCEAVSTQFDPQDAAAERAHAEAQKALHAAIAGRRCEAENASRSALSRADDALTNLVHGRADAACGLGFLTGQVHGFRLGLQVAARALQGTPADMLRLIEAAGDDAAAARLIAELVGAASARGGA